MRNQFCCLLQKSVHLMVAIAFLGLASAASAAPVEPTNVQFVERSETSALIRWTPTVDEVQGYKVRRSEIPGVHLDSVQFPNGKTWAFTWTTDDGLDDNLVYDQIFAPRGLRFTAFLNGARIGLSGKLTWNEVRALYANGHEIANHGADHLAMIDDRAFSIRYVGLESCVLEIAGGQLTTTVAGLQDLQFDLTNPLSNHLVELSALVDADPSYESTLLYSDLMISATQSQFLDPITIPIGSGAPAGTLTTARGVHDDNEMLDQIQRSAEQIELEIRMADPSYEIRTFAYPNHAHRQRVMTLLNELGYSGSRSGITGERPFFSEGSLLSGFMTSYEVPMNSPRPSNGWDETFTRTKYQNRVAAWKSSNSWVVLMAHGEAESDSQHVDWMIDEIAADPDVWIAPFGEVVALMNQSYVDVGVAVDSTGMVSAWVHDLDPATEYYAVVTAYNAPLLEESGWSTEVIIPAYTPVAVPSSPSRRVSTLTAAPDPMVDWTKIGFTAPSPGPAVLNVYDVRGSRVVTRELGSLEAGAHSIIWRANIQSGRRLPGGVYFIRISGREWADTRRVVIVR